MISVHLLPSVVPTGRPRRPASAFTYVSLAVIGSGAMPGPGGLRAQAPGTTVPVLATPSVTAFVDVAVIPMDRERVLPHQTVVVRGHQIVALGPVAKVLVPREAARVDGRDRFLLPGLTDMHAHILMGGWQTTQAAVRLFSGRIRLFRYVASGVTTIRDMFGTPQTLQLKAEAATGAFLSPRLYVSVRPGISGLAHLSSHPDSAVRLAKQAGFDFIKFWSAPTGAELDSILVVAARVDLPIAGHAPNEDNLLAIREHYRSVEHLLGFWGGGQAAQNARDDAWLAATARALKEAGVWVCPTLTHMVLNFTPPVDSVTDTATLYRAVRALRNGGVGLLAGTDAMDGPRPRDLVSDELADLVKAGLTPYEALVTATRNPAVYFGTLDSTGTVAVGKRADLVLLAGNPLADIRQVAALAGVMVNGQWRSQAELAQMTALLPDPREDLPDMR